MRERFEQGRKLASSSAFVRLVSNDRVMHVANGIMDARNRLNAAREHAAEAWNVLVNGHALPTIDPALEGEAEVTGFTNGEEAGVGLTKVVPFLVEDELLRLGATYSKVKDWGVLTVKDDLLITGQNPASSGPADNS